MKIQGLFLTACLLFSIVSCSKTPGCMDTNAENFNSDAEKDNGSCSYRGSMVIYHNEQTSMKLINEGVTSVKLYLNGSFYDAMSPSDHYESAPQCGDSKAMNLYEYGMGQNKTTKFQYDIKDQNDQVLSSGEFTLEGNQCKSLRYNY